MLQTRLHDRQSQTRFHESQCHGRIVGLELYAWHEPGNGAGLQERLSRLQRLGFGRGNEGLTVQPLRQEPACGKWVSCGDGKQEFFFGTETTDERPIRWRFGIGQTDVEVTLVDRRKQRTRTQTAQLQSHVRSPVA